MTQNRYYHPEPAPSPHEQGPPTAEHSNLPGDEGVWAAARRSYVEGCSTPVVAERHGLNERTVRRRAAAEDWPALRRARSPGATLWGAALGRAPTYAGEPLTPEEASASAPQIEPFTIARNFEVGELLLRPEPERLARFAFRRSAEAAAQGAAAEAVSWMRLVASIERSRGELDRVLRSHDPADAIRASYAEAVRRYWEDQERAEAEMDEDGGTEAGDVSGCPDVR